MTDILEKRLRKAAADNGQEQVFKFWDRLDDPGRKRLLASLDAVDFTLLQRLINTWVLEEPPEEHFTNIVPVPVIPVANPTDPEARAAYEAGEQALRAGKVAAFVVAGGQGTRLGFDGPKGSYSIGPITGKSLFQYHAEKIRNLQKRYQTALPWYVMVSHANEAATRAFFQDNHCWGLDPANILFIKQRMVPCVDTNGKLMLEAPDCIATSPNGHGGSIQALVDGGAIEDARRRGIKVISFIQVDNWAVKVADPYFIGYHCLRNAAMSSKCHRRNDMREAVGVHCLCDDEYRVIEYSELDLYPQLLQADENGQPVFFAGNPAIHLLSVAFVSELYEHFETFPWHRAFKRISFVDDSGTVCKPTEPNGYKFETFVFDALRFTSHPPVTLEINRAGEYTPIKQYDGINSVVEARASMADYWADWFEAAGCEAPRDEHGHCMVPLEVSPAFALNQEEFVANMADRVIPLNAGGAINADGSWTQGNGRST